MKTLIIIVDVQNGFINDRSRSVISPLQDLVKITKEDGLPLVFTRFINKPGSGYERWIHWTRLQSSPEIDIVPELVEDSKLVFDKYGYSAFTPEFEDYIKHEGVVRLVIAGIATDGCVLKTAVDAFERGIEPIVVSDACRSHAGNEVHEAGLMLISRFIGRGQVVTLSQLLKKLST